MKDACARTIDYLRVSITDRCNLRCLYCMPAHGIPKVKHDDILRFDEIITVVRVASRLGVRHIRLTGGEPLVRKGVVQLIEEIRAIPGIDDISLTTNGVLLAPMAHELRRAGLDRINISLDTFDPDQYRTITRCGDIRHVLEGIDAALDEGFDPVKINAVAVRNLHQDFYSYARSSIDRPLHMRFIEYMPIGDSAGINDIGWGPQDIVSCEDIRKEIDREAVKRGEGPLYALSTADRPYGSGPASYWKFPDAKGTVGFISPISHQFCLGCNRIRLSAQGGIRPCLFSDEEYPIRDVVRYGTEHDVEDVLLRAIAHKPRERRDVLQAHATKKNMNAIGG